MSFTDQKPFPVTEEAIRTFTKHRKFWGCALCGRVFVPGDVARWVYANGTPGLGCGNFFVCPRCDGYNSDVLGHAKQNFEEALDAAKRWRLIE